ncbi:MAG: hypothetical protein LBD68_03500, partial [Zoogloeaceae bacterium]|nr:hypothetical protein [Zoogloeaceae bacterium]
MILSCLHTRWAGFTDRKAANRVLKSKRFLRYLAVAASGIQCREHLPDCRYLVLQIGQVTGKDE